MSLLIKLIHGQVCKSTHHKLAIDALMAVQGHANEAWQNYFIGEYRSFLDGAKIPDTQFRDFKNHVLHTSENNWGGAISAAQEWFQKSIKLCKERRWQDLAQAVGVLTHYVSDPFMPLHTGQTEAEGIIHRACEWSVTRSYDQLKTILDTELGGVVRSKKSNSDNWLQQLITQGAQSSHKTYDEIVSRYDLKVGTKDPVAGLDQVSRRLFAKCIGECISALTLVLEKIMEQAGAVPPAREVTVHDVIKHENISQSWIKKNLQDKDEQQAAIKVLDEVNSRGKAIHSLSQECQDVRRLHAEQVLKVSLNDLDQETVTLPGQKYGQADSRVFSQNQSIEKYLTISLPGSGAESVYKSLKVAPGEVREPSKYRKTLALTNSHQRLRGVEGMNIPRKNLSAASPRSVISEPVSVSTKSPQAMYVTAHHQDTVENYSDNYSRRDNEHQEYSRHLPEMESHSRTTRTDSEHSNNQLSREERRRLKQERKRQHRDQREARTHQQFYSQERTNTAVDAENDQVLSPRLTMDSPLVDAPSIGPKTARRFANCRIHTVGQFLQADVHQLAQLLNASHITPQLLSEWQIQARWCTILPKFRGADAHAFVALNFREPQDIAHYAADNLLNEITHFMMSKDGARITRESQPPKLEIVQIWLDWVNGVQQQVA